MYPMAGCASADYQGIQLQLNRRLKRGLRALASYSWAQSVDTASAGSAFGNSANALVPALGAAANRGPSDFDIRHSFSGGVTYDIPVARQNSVAKAILKGWSLQTVLQSHSALPVNVYIPALSQMLDSAISQVRPDVVSGIPLYLSGSSYPGGKGFNGNPGAVPSGCPDGSVSVGPFALRRPKKKGCHCDKVVWGGMLCVDLAQLSGTSVFTEYFRCMSRWRFKFGRRYLMC